MARPKKTRKLDADDRTIVKYFDLSMEAKANQKSASADISDLNSRMQDDGVDPGMLSWCRRLAELPEGRRGVSIALLHRYLQVLASRLDDPTAREAEASTAVPFGKKSAAA